VVAILCGACGGGAALMHPAHPLPVGRTSVGVGTAYTFALGDTRRAIDRASSLAASGTAEDASEQQLFEGVAAHTVVAPGASPWVGARVGLGESNEAGLTYTGRAVRVDARHGFERGSLALSGGAGATMVLANPRSDPPAGTGAADTTSGEIPGVDAGSVRGFGFDVPLVVGIRSEPDILAAWGGLRGRYEQLSGAVLLRTAPDPSAERSTDLETTTLAGGALLGLRAGFPPFWVTVELGAEYAHVSATLDEAVRRTGSIGGWSLTPAGAIVGQF
jgi:hypothetical protein